MKYAALLLVLLCAPTRRHRNHPNFDTLKGTSPQTTIPAWRLRASFCRNNTSAIQRTVPELRAAITQRYAANSYSHWGTGEQRTQDNDPVESRVDNNGTRETDVAICYAHNLCAVLCCSVDGGLPNGDEVIPCTHYPTRNNTHTTALTVFSPDPECHFVVRSCLLLECLGPQLTVPVDQTQSLQTGGTRKIPGHIHSRLQQTGLYPVSSVSHWHSSLPSAKYKV